MLRSGGYPCTSFGNKTFSNYAIPKDVGRFKDLNSKNIKQFNGQIRDKNQRIVSAVHNVKQEYLRMSKIRISSI